MYENSQDIELNENDYRELYENAIELGLIVC